MAKTGCRIYVGNLPPDIRTKDIHDLFYKFGKVLVVDLKNQRGPPFAFIEFDDPRDAEDAVRSRDGYDYDGYRLRVEYPRGQPYNSKRGDRFGGSSYSGGGGYRNNRDNSNYHRSGNDRNRRTKRTNNRVIITGLPPSGSWQDVKDHMREAGDVCYADVHKDGTGVVEFVHYEDMKYALKKLDDSRFRSHEGEIAYVRVKEASSDYSSPTRVRQRSRSRSYSPVVRRRSSPYSPVRRSYSRSAS